MRSITWHNFLIVLCVSSFLQVNLAAKKRRCDAQNRVTILAHDIDVGYKNDPTPITPECLNVQEVFNATTTIFYGASVEPSIAVNPKNRCNIVATWQQDRINNGGALEAGIAYTFDGGKTWRNSVIPVQICTGGLSQRVSDVWLAFAADGSRVYLNFLNFNATDVPGTDNEDGIGTSVSYDGGATWSEPAVLFSTQSFLNEQTGQFPIPDKNSITADPNSPAFAYSVWDTFPNAFSFHSNTFLSRTTNGGLTWSVPSLVYDPFPDLTAIGLSNGIFNDCQTLNNIVVVLPALRGGNLLNVMTRIYAKPGATDNEYMNDTFPFKFGTADFAFVRSVDQGVNWAPTATVITRLDINSVVFTGGYTYDARGNITGGVGTMLRTADLTPSANVNPCNGNLYAVWQTGQFRKDRLPQIGLVTSRDGGKMWSEPVRINQTPQNAPNSQAFTPFVAVTENGYVGVLYSDFRNDTKTDPNNTLTDTWLAIYKETRNPNGGGTKIGLRFIKEVRLSKKSYIAQNGPATTRGDMVNGDYSFLTTIKNVFCAAYTKSFDGPFKPAEIIFEDPVHNAIVKLDNNRRQNTFVSVVRVK